MELALPIISRLAIRCRVMGVSCRQRGASSAFLKSPSSAAAVRFLTSPSRQSIPPPVARPIVRRSPGTAIELSNRDPIIGLLPLLVRHERGEGWGEGKVNKDGTPLPNPLFPSKGKRGRRASVTCFLRFLNSMAVHPKPSSI